MKYIFSILLLMPTLVLAYSSPGSQSGLVNDFAEVLSATERQRLESKLVDFEKETSHEVSVVTVRNLGGDTIENFAEELFKDWGIGKKQNDNGVLLLVSLEDRAIRIEVGYGLEGALTDTEASWIIRDLITPPFKRGDYYGGLDAGVGGIMEAVKGEVVPTGNKSKSSSSGLPEALLFLGLFIFVALASVLGRSKSWWAGGVVGGVVGVIIGLIKGFVFLGVIALSVLIPFGLLFDFIVSRAYQRAKDSGGRIPWWFGGGGFGGRGGTPAGGGGFGGFGGGSSGGGGASSKW